MFASLKFSDANDATPWSSKTKTWTWYRMGGLNNYSHPRISRLLVGPNLWSRWWISMLTMLLLHHFWLKIRKILSFVQTMSAKLFSSRKFSSHPRLQTVTRDLDPLPNNPKEVITWKLQETSLIVDMIHHQLYNYKKKYCDAFVSWQSILKSIKSVNSFGSKWIGDETIGTEIILVKLFNFYSY